MELHKGHGAAFEWGSHPVSSLRTSLYKHSGFEQTVNRGISEPHELGQAREREAAGLGGIPSSLERQNQAVSSIA